MDRPIGGAVASSTVPNAERVRAQLERILQSRQFRRAEIAGRILRVIVEQSLSQEQGIPCEKSIGPAVFGAGFDPASTSSIRVRIKEIRQKLRDYYQTAQPSRDTVWIEIPDGRYRAYFSHQAQPSRSLSSIDSGRRHDRAIPCNAAAAAHYSEGMRLWTQRNPDSIRGAAACFEAALGADPAYSPAHVGLVNCCLFRVILGERPQSLIGPALQAALKAVERDPESAGAHAALGAVRSILQFRWADAESEYLKARALDPDAPDLLGWYSGHAAALGRFAEAIEMVSRLEFIEPLSFFVTAHAAKVLLFCGDYASALARASALVSIVSGMDLAHSLLGMAQCALGDFEAGIPALETAADLSHRAPRNLGVLGYYLGVQGRTDRAEAILRELQRQAETEYVPQSMPAVLLAGLGRTDEAFACLDRAFAGGDFFLAMLRVWPPFLSLRSDPRYQGLLDRIFGV